MAGGLLTDAAWAQRCGLFTEVFAEIGALERRLMELSNKFATYPRRATEQVKRMVGEGFSEKLPAQLAQRVRAVSELVITPEAQALIQAAKR